LDFIIFVSLKASILYAMDYLLFAAIRDFSNTDFPEDKPLKNEENWCQLTYVLSYFW